MTPYRSLSIALYASLSIGFSACTAGPYHSEIPTMTTDRVHPPTSATTSTFCVGRFLIGAPPGSTISGGNYKYDFAAIEPVKPMSIEEFDKQVTKQEADLKAAINRRTKQSMLLQSIRPDKETGILASWEVPASTAQIKISGYRWVGNHRFLVEDTVDDDKRKLGIDGMRDTLARIRARADSDIPAEPGFCFAGGLIANPRWRNEEAQMDIDIAGHPDVFLSVWTYPLASHKRDRPLLERMSGMHQSLGKLAASVQVLRKGDRQIASYKGQEHLVAAPNSGGMRAHAFVWEAQGDGTLDTPAIKIELTTGHQDDKGNPQKTTLTDQQAMKLWDDILNSLRLRPANAAVKTGALHPGPHSSVPLGELVSTGGACPQTGWWQSTQAGDIEGGRRKRFEAGESMPAIVLLGEPSMWQKLKGERPTHRAATVWKLIGYDEAADSPTLSSAENERGSPAQDSEGQTPHQG